MFNILIVDDEKIEREGIKFLLRKFNIELEVFEAENGKKAFELLKNTKVDILFTDIKMPFMSGLELATQAKQMYKEIKIIVYSAYGEFEYTKKAININVNKYILKPIKKDEFLEVINEIIELCYKEKQEMNKLNEVMEFYEKGIQHEREKLLLDLINNVKIDGTFLSRVEKTKLNLLNIQINPVIFDFKQRFFEKNDVEFRSLLEGFYKNKYVYINLNERRSVLFLIIDLEEHQIDLKSFSEQLKKNVMMKFNSMMNIVIGKALDKIEYITSEINTMEAILDYQYSDKQGMLLVTNETTATTEDELINSYEKKIDNRSYTRVINEVIEIINNNYSKDLSIEYIAEKVYLTPNYLNFIFKKIMKISLGKYITNYRLKKAEELLLNTNMKVIVIGKEVGYDNNSYFCSLFKRYYGETPIRFREREK